MANFSPKSEIIMQNTPEISFPLPADLSQPWTEQQIRAFLKARRAEDLHFECKAFLHFDWELKCLAEKLGQQDLALRPFHSPKAADSIMAYKVIQTIMGFANAKGGLILLGVAEQNRSERLPAYEEGIPVESATGAFDFLVTGIEPDGIGMVDDRINEDEFKRQLQQILFPKSKKPQSYTELKENKAGNQKATGNEADRAPFKKETTRVDYCAVFRDNAAWVVEQVKLVAFTRPGGRPLPVAALVIPPQLKLIDVVESKNDGPEVFKIYLRLAFNNNGPLTGGQVREYIYGRMRKESGAEIVGMYEALLEKMARLEDAGAKAHPVRAAKAPEDLVPAKLRELLPDYLPPVSDGRDFTAKIHRCIDEGCNCFVIGDSGMGKSLLMAHAFLSRAEADLPICYYAIERVLGKDAFATQTVLKEIRRQIEAMEGMPAVQAPERDLSEEAYWREKTHLHAVIKVWNQTHPERQLVVFIDGLDENFLENEEHRFILNVLKGLIIDPLVKATWVLSSQPRPTMEWIKPYFTVLALEGLSENQAKKLLGRNLPEATTRRHPGLTAKLTIRTKMPNGLFDPEMLMILAKAMGEKIGPEPDKLSFISPKVLERFIKDLPLTVSDKYQWLFARFTDHDRLTDIPSLKDNGRRWAASGTAVPYCRLLAELLALMALVRKPIPHELLLNALSLEDLTPQPDFWGEARPAFKAMIDGSEVNTLFVSTAIRDLQRFIKILEASEGRTYAYFKEVIRQAALALLDPAVIGAARQRLAALGAAAVARIKPETLAHFPGYLYDELFFFLSLAPEKGVASIEALFNLECLPEWVQGFALHKGSNWVSNFLGELHWALKAEKAGIGFDRLVMLRRVLMDWRYHLESFPGYSAPFIRSEKRIISSWPGVKRCSGLLGPEGGYQRRVQGHTEEISCLAVLPDGRITSGSTDNTVRVWDLTTRQGQVLEGHESSVSCLAVLPDGRIASGSWDNTVRVWDLITGQSLVLEGHDSLVICLAVLPDGRIASGSDDKTVRVWDLTTGQGQVLEGHESSVRCLAVLPDGRIASGSWDNTVRVWDLTTGQGQVLEGHGHSVSCLAVLPDGRIASGSDGNTVRVWDLTTGQGQVLEGHGHSVSCLAVLPDGRIASGSWDKTVRVWDLTTGQGQVLEGHENLVSCLAVLPDGRIASGSTDNTVRVWDLTTRQGQVLEGHEGSVRCLAVLPDGRIASGSDDKTVRVWDLTTGQGQVLEGHEGSVRCLAVLPDGRIASGSWDKTVRVWDLTTGQGQVLEGHEDLVSCLAVLPDGRIASGSWDKTVRVWDLTTGQGQVLEGHGVTCFAVLPDGRIASGSWDKTVRVWDLTTGQGQVLEGHGHSVSCLAVLPDGRIASGSDGNTVRVWDLTTGQGQVLEGHGHSVSCLAVLPDGRIASGSWDKTVRVWDLTTGQGQVLEGHEGSVRCLAVLPDGRIASGSWDKTVRVWDLTTGQGQVLEGHGHSVSCLAVLPDGRIASGSNDNTVRVWDLKKGMRQIGIGFTETAGKVLIVLAENRVAVGGDFGIQIFKIPKSV